MYVANAQDHGAGDIRGILMIWQYTHTVERICQSIDQDVDDYLIFWSDGSVRVNTLTSEPIIVGRTARELNYYENKAKISWDAWKELVRRRYVAVSGKAPYEGKEFIFMDGLRR